jgi:hypothetical protein
MKRRKMGRLKYEEESAWRKKKRESRRNDIILKNRVQGGRGSGDAEDMDGRMECREEVGGRKVWKREKWR